MAWGRIDDRMYSHRKTMRIPRARRCEAMGLWMLANSWCNNHGTGGRVPRDIWDEFGSTEEVADLLVDAGYWIVTEDGYEFANWGEFNLTSDDLQAKREAEAERKRRWREAKKGSSEGSPAAVPLGQRDMSLPVPHKSSAVTPASALTHTHTHTQEHEETCPSAPPTDDDQPATSGSNRVRRRDGDPPGFIEFWEIYPLHQSRGAAVKAFVRARRKADLETILAGARRYAADPNRKPDFTAHAATWLNADRWTDEPIPTQSERPGGSLWQE